jgi:hypothetical protein
MSEHAKLSPSGAHRWMRCPASLRREEDFPDESSVYAQEGTRAHEAAAAILEGREPQWEEDDIVSGMPEHVQSYVDLVHELAHGGTLLVEQRVSFSPYMGGVAASAFGTSDAVILKDLTLTVVDLKYGMGVKVDAEDNEQLMLYALGCLNEFGWYADFNEVRLVIHMPRLSHVSEHVISVEELVAFAGRAKAAAHAALAPDAPYEPGAKQCRFCRARGACEALNGEVMRVVAATADEFNPVVPDDSDALSEAMSKVDLVEVWCKGVRAEVERRLLANQTVPGYKLVEGRQGPRGWRDAEAVERMFKSWRLKKEDVYDLSLISPTKAQKMLSNTPKRWAKLEALIQRSAGKLSVAPATDRRPAMSASATADEFG